ncbi:hypothetical protein E2K93_08895 [Thalassotalea sp. HSM 43]|uniref:hypothetical protein n=1 Tax=Thalassotalea sp. HSM 43 TaxID=2552945 RepID=UPI001081038D|nr:hypothetical protein [Thalassotalea sp. HSM 43]QBY04498.1 hypothetical protein E2K93_08895 [Thalassotalea sp. HSM 43]
MKKTDKTLRYLTFIATSLLLMACVEESEPDKDISNISSDAKLELKVSMNHAINDIYNDLLTDGEIVGKELITEKSLHVYIELLDINNAIIEVTESDVFTITLNDKVYDLADYFQEGNDALFASPGYYEFFVNDPEVISSVNIKLSHNGNRSATFDVPAPLEVYNHSKDDEEFNIFTDNVHLQWNQGQPTLIEGERGLTYSDGSCKADFKQNIPENYTEIIIEPGDFSSGCSGGSDNTNFIVDLKHTEELEPKVDNFDKLSFQFETLYHWQDW